MSERRTLRIFCPIHEAGFDAPASRKILCEITGHTLSTDFPNAEVWEYCCNCATFSTSKLGKGEKARNSCFSCQNEISKRFVCAHCKTLSFECSVKSRGQAYFVSGVGIAPACPACQFVLSDKVVSHDCEEIGAEIVTTHETCPFCLESTSTGFVLPQSQASGIAKNVCPQCHIINPVDTVFCGNCRYQLHESVARTLGTDVHKSLALGSLCPNCSTPIPPNSEFCGECGQAIKMSAVPPPPPPPPPSGRTGRLTNSIAAAVEAGKEAYSAEKLKSPSVGASLDNPEPITNILQDPTFKIFAGLGGGLVIFIILVVAISSATRSSAVPSNSVPGSNSYPTNTNTRRPPAISATPNSSNRDYRINKTGTLSRDVNLREIPGGTDAVYKVGTHYRGARVMILDVAPAVDSNGNTFDWLKIKVTKYGESMDANNYRQEKDPGSSDVGWIHSYPNVSQNSTPVRVNSVDFDN